MSAGTEDPVSMITQWDRRFFDAAVAEAEQGFSEAGVPIGSSLQAGDVLLGSGRNRRVQDGDPVAHAEISCLHNVGRRAAYRDTVLYTTLAPCAMCSGAVILFKISTLVIGESRTFPGELELLESRGVEIVLLEDQRCYDLMQRFIEQNPEIWDEDIAERR